MELIKVRLHKTKKGNGLVLTYKRQDPGDDVDGSETHRALIHQDCQAAIDALAIHLAILTFYVKTGEVQDIAAPEPELSEKFHVNGYSIGGDDDNPGIVISGHHNGPNNLAVILNSPFRKFDENPGTRYEFMDDLQARVRVIESEIESYLNGDKRGTAAAPELPFNSGEKVTEEGNLAPSDSKHKYANKDAMARVGADEKPKRGGKKKPAAEPIAADVEDLPS